MFASLNRHFIQPLAGWKIGSPHLVNLRTLERTQFDPPDVIRERQLSAVRAIVRHAWETVPYYRDRWAAARRFPRTRETSASVLGCRPNEK